MSDIILQCQNLSKQFKEAKKTVAVLHDIDFSLRAGQGVAIVGASGSGKSTLLHLLGGLDKPSTGEVLWGDTRLSQLSEDKRSRLRNRYLGFVYQFHHLLAEFSALENVMMPLLLREMSPKRASEKAKHLLDEVGLTHRLTHKLSELSGGERQRVAIARALVGDPRCVLADEPTGNLDQKTSEKVMDLLLSLQAKLKLAFIIVTHNEKLAQALQSCYALENGHLLRDQE